MGRQREEMRYGRDTLEVTQGNLNVLKGGEGGGRIDNRG